MRTNAPSYGKRTMFGRDAFEGFVKAYTGGIGLHKVKTDYNGAVDDEKRKAVKDARWQCFTREQIAAKSDSLDIGLVEDEGMSKNGNLGEPVDIAREAAKELATIQEELNKIIGLLK